MVMLSRPSRYRVADGVERTLAIALVVGKFYGESSGGRRRPRRADGPDQAAKRAARRAYL